MFGPQACDAWKKEAEEAGERASTAGAECELAREQRDALEVQVKKLQEELERLHSGPDPQALPAFSDLEALSLSTLYSLQKQLRARLEQVDKVSPGGSGSPGWGCTWPQRGLGSRGPTLLWGCTTLLRAPGRSWQGARESTPLPGVVRRGTWEGGCDLSHGSVARLSERCPVCRRCGTAGPPGLFCLRS